MNKHGDWGTDINTIETTYSKPVTIETLDGEQIGTISMSSHSQSVSDRYCGKCAEWKRAKGIMGGILCVDCGTEWHAVAINTDDDLDSTSKAWLAEYEEINNL